MKFTALFITVTALAAPAAAWSDTAPAHSGLSHRQALEQQDEARYRVCDAQRAENPATHTIDFTTSGRRCLVTALGQVATVPGTLVLLRNASATLRKTPDPALRQAALRAVARARVQLASDLPSLGARFRDEAAALDLAELSIYQPQLHYQQQQWRLATYASQSSMERRD